MNYQQAIEFIQSFPDAERGLPGRVGARVSAPVPSRSLKMPLSTMKALLKKMGYPQYAASVIHITGSKGKGSTATFIASILKQAGLRTALFTSPHIHSYTERIAFNGAPISEDVFAQGIDELRSLIEEFDHQGKTISTFGILTALFFHLSQSLSYHWQVVEVGLGGKDDLTNVFQQKEVAVITPISLEHTAILGLTKIAIAENKAGIITPGCLVVLAPQPDADVVKIIREICAQKEAELIEVGSLGYNPLPHPIQLKGEHQISNAMTALTVIDALEKRKKFIVPLEAIEKGLAEAFLPGRFEVIEPGQQYSYPLFVLDGAHNDDSAQALAKTLHQVFPDRRVVLIIGVNQDKDLEGIWGALKHSVSAVVATRSDNYRSMPPQEISNRIRACDSSTQVICADNIDEAITTAKEIVKKMSEVVICICGSLYLVAEARERLLDAVPETE